MARPATTTLAAATAHEVARLAAQIATTTQGIDYLNTELADDTLGAGDRRALTADRRELRSLRGTARRLLANLSA
tara:strand:+ start:136 stop:360 length:225 start_codon:yes stop_codon:yes gene_type:complete